MTTWFVTWDRPEYKEWAKQTKRGYLLVILRKETSGYLCAKVELIMGKEGLPAVEVTKEHHFSLEKEAIKQIAKWKTEE